MPSPNRMQVRELLLQALVHERGGTLVYSTALECAVDDDLREEWEKYLEQTVRHVDILTGVCVAMGLDPDEMTPGCQVVHHNGKSLVIAMKMARADGNPEAAQLVACDCVVLAETKDHANWELIGQCAKQMEGDAATLLQQAYDEVEDEEDEHLYHTKGWCRELWLKSLGFPAVLPPPEEEQHVKTAIEAAKVDKSRQQVSVKPRS
jgi:rubrerythrin